MTPKPILTWIQSRTKTDNQALTTPLPEEPLKQLQVHTPKPASEQRILSTDKESKEKILDVEMHLIETAKDQSDNTTEENILK